MKGTIYKAKVGSKIYIGQTKNLNKRISSHMSRERVFGKVDKPIWYVCENEIDNVGQQEFLWILKSGAIGKNGLNSELPNFTPNFALYIILKIIAFLFLLGKSPKKYLDIPGQEFHGSVGKPVIRISDKRFYRTQKEAAIDNGLKSSSSISYAIKENQMAANSYWRFASDKEIERNTID